MIIKLTMKCGDIIRFESGRDFDKISEDILNQQWRRVKDLEGIKVVFNIDNLKYISHEQTNK